MPEENFFITLGCIGLGQETLGAVLPLLPAFLFLLLAAFCFGKKLGTAAHMALVQNFTRINWKAMLTERVQKH